MGLADPAVLDDEYRAALEVATDVLVDRWLVDVRQTPPSRPIDPGGGMAGGLPAKHLHRYDGRFAVSLLWQLFIVLDRLADPDVSPVANLEFVRWFDRFDGGWSDPEPRVQDDT